MSAGSITTARGVRLNMGELKLRQRKPAVQRGDMKDKVERPQKPIRQVNVQGYMPSMEGVLCPSAEQQPVRTPQIVIDETEPSIADFTGVIVDQVRGHTGKNAAESANETLNAIIGDLEQHKRKVGVPPLSETPRTRRSK